MSQTYKIYKLNIHCWW